MSEPSTEHAERAVEILSQREGLATLIELNGGESHICMNVAVGRDIAADYDHVTTNVSPEVSGLEIGFFLTNELDTLSDPKSGTMLWSKFGPIAEK